VFGLLSQFDLTDVWCWILFPAALAMAWGSYLWLLITGRNPLVLEDRSDVPWGLIDVVLLFASMMAAKMVGQVVGMVMIAQRLEVPVSGITAELAYQNGDLLMGANIVCSLLQLVLVLYWIRFWQNATWVDLGMTWRGLRRQVCIGLVASVLLIPPLLFLNMIIHWLLEVEYSHQVLILVQYAAGWTAVSTILVAPCLEEIHFRVFLQGWLERVRSIDLGKKLQLIYGDRHALSSSRSDGGRRLSMDSQPAGSESRGEKAAPVWPMFLSALVFAGMHWGQGAGPYTLFVFAIGLGYLYRQTHSVVACVIVHLVLNLWSFVALVSSLDLV
jgi:membrane protease YdiL (CAAX protease family)